MSVQFDENITGEDEQLRGLQFARQAAKIPNHSLIGADSWQVHVQEASNSRCDDMNLKGTEN